MDMDFTKPYKAHHRNTKRKMTGMENVILEHFENSAYDRRVRVVIALAVRMHNTYEAVAKETGWKTQTECKTSFDDLPEANKRVMLAVADDAIDYVLKAKTMMLL